MAFEGIPLPDHVVRDIAQNFIDKLDATDLTIIEWVVGTLPEDVKESFRTAFRKRPGKARLGYGWDQTEDWQITVIVPTTQAVARTLGDVGGPTDVETVYADGLTADITEHRNIVLPLSGPLPPPLVGGIVALDDEWAICVTVGADLVLLYRGVRGTVAVPHAAGTTARFLEFTSRVGWGEFATVRADVLSSNAVFNGVLATAIKAALLANNLAFENAGVTLRGITESDLTPRPEVWPAYLLHRSLMIECQRDFMIPETIAVLLDVTTDITDP
jgi:hypothetical protein